ncbi:MAG: hypothetical protein OXT71_18010 [Acidobacteriota bacterium]|nr:hypothetical protein [Acidobacteriota bacterium]
MRQIKRVLGVFGTILFLASTHCSRNMEEPAAGGAVSSGTVSAAGAAGDLLFTAPDGWIEETPTSSMRKAQYRLPRAGGDSEDGELVVFHFPGQGGTIEANINRWVGQFSPDETGGGPSKAEVAPRTANGVRLMLVDVSGTYRPSSGPMMRPGDPKKGYRMLAVIAQTASGPWFFKLTGPRKTIDNWHQDFLAFLDTIRPGG